MGARSAGRPVKLSGVAAGAAFERRTGCPAVILSPARDKGILSGYPSRMEQAT